MIVRRNQAALESAEAVLEANCVDAAVLDLDRVGRSDFVRAEAAAAGGAARLTVTASGIEAVAPSSAVALSAGESHLLAVATNTQLSIPGVVQVHVEAWRRSPDPARVSSEPRGAGPAVPGTRRGQLGFAARAAANARADAERI